MTADWKQITRTRKPRTVPTIAGPRTVPGETWQEWHHTRCIEAFAEYSQALAYHLAYYPGTCQVCGGSGKHYWTEYGSVLEDDCEFCLGSGYCPHCGEELPADRTAQYVTKHHCGWEWLDDNMELPILPPPPECHCWADTGNPANKERFK